MTLILLYLEPWYSSEVDKVKYRALFIAYIFYSLRGRRPIRAIVSRPQAITTMMDVVATHLANKLIITDICVLSDNMWIF